MQLFTNGNWIEEDKGVEYLWIYEMSHSCDTNWNKHNLDELKQDNLL